MGLVSIGAKLAGLVERLLPGLGGGGDAGSAAAAGGAGLLGVGGAKLAGLLAVGAAATGGGLMVAQDAHHGTGGQASSARTVRAAPARAVAASATSAPSLAAAPVRAAPAKGKARRVAVRGIRVRPSADRRAEFAPRGRDLATEPTASAIPKAVRAAAPQPVAPGSDSTRGEFAPQP